MVNTVSEAQKRALRTPKPGKLPTKPQTVIGATAVDRRMQEMVAAAKRGEGTLIFKPNK